MRYACPLIILLLFHFYSMNAQTKDRNLNSILEKAYKLNPELQMLNSEVKVAELNAIEESNLPDPVLGLGLNNLPVESFGFDTEPMTGKSISLSQSFPFPGKLTSKEEMMKKDAEINKEKYKLSKLKLRKEIIDNYYSLSYQLKKLSLLNEKLNVFEALIPVVKTRYEVSKASQQNLIQLQLRISDIKEQIANQQGKLDETRFVLEGLSGSEINNDLQTALDSIVFPSPEKEKLYLAIKANNPQLQQVELQIAKANKLYDLSEYDFYPNFNISLKYTQRDKLAATGINQNDFLSASLGITLPLNYGGKNTAKLDKSLQIIDQYKSLYHNLYLRVTIALNQAISKMNTNVKRTKILNDTILLQANENYKSALSAYQVGESEFTDVIESLNKLLNYEDELYSLKLENIKAITSIELMCGLNLL